MIIFEENVDKLPTYGKNSYAKKGNWYGVSFQLEGGYEGKKIDTMEFIRRYESWFEQIILRMDNGTNWIVNHDYEGKNWFPNNQENLTALRKLFKQNGVPNTFKGAIIFTKNDLLEFSKDLITYPFEVLSKERRLYSDLNISHGELEFVIKISAHMNIDLLSADIELLRAVVNESASNIFIRRAYRGTFL